MAHSFTPDLGDPREIYLGEGVYAGFDGFCFHLRVPSEMYGFKVDDIVYLSPHVLKAFNAYAEQCLH